MRTFAAFSFVAALLSSASAATIPFTEDFNNDSANWRNAANSAVLDWNNAGSVDAGAYAFGDFNFVATAENDTPVILRGNAGSGASGGAFAGNYIAEGVTQLTAYVRHNAPTPLNFFTRFVSAANFPGAVAVDFAPVLPNTWTQISFAINPASPQFITFEGANFNAVFSNIARVQFGVSVPAALAGVDQAYTFDLDKVTITPEPASAALLLLGMFALRGFRR